MQKYSKEMQSIILNGVKYHLVKVEEEPPVVEICPVVEEGPPVIEDCENKEENKEDWHKMDMMLDKIETGDLAALQAYITAGHPNIKINRRSTVGSLTDALLAELYQNASKKQIKDSGPRVRAILNSQTGNINHLAKRFTQLRKVLVARFGENSDMYRWHRKNGLEYDQFIDKQQMQDLVRENKLANLTRVDEKDIHEILNKTSASDNLFDNIIALQIATGSRFIEAVRVSRYQKVPYSDNVVKVIGVAKKGKEGETYELDRPIFGLDIDELLKLWEHVRKELKRNYKGIDKLSNEEVGKMLNGSVNTHVKALGIEGVNSSHAMRKLFAAITHAELPDENRKIMDRHLHIKNVLGHKKIDTAANYANVRVNKRRNKFKSNEQLEEKLDVIDKVNDRQDTAIEELQETSTQVVVGPEVKTSVENRTQVFKLKNLKGESVQIVDDYSRQRGNGRNRAVNLMEQLRDNSVIITEKVLKLLNVGSKTISLVKDLKKQFNAEILAEIS